MTRPRAPARTGAENIASKPCVTPMGKPQKAIPMKTPARHWRRSKISPMPRSMLFPQQCSTHSYFTAERERHLAFIAVDCLPKCDRSFDDLHSHAVRYKPWETFASVSCSSLFAVFAPTYSRAGVFISVGFAPPPLPIYEQPFCPGPDFIWTPGYWAYDEDVEDYYWVRW